MDSMLQKGYTSVEATKTLKIPGAPYRVEEIKDIVRR
jgi:hypothetical protein